MSAASPETKISVSPIHSPVIQFTLRNALKEISVLSASSGDALFNELFAKINDNTINELNPHSSSGKAMKLAKQSISTYHQLMTIAAGSAQFDHVLLAAKNHVVDSLEAWSKSEYEDTIFKLSMDYNLFTFKNEAEKERHHEKILKNELELWILKQLDERLKHKDLIIMDNFLQSQAEPYSEEDETIKMISWFSVVYRAYNDEKKINGKVLCDIAHPTTVAEVIQTPEDVFKILNLMTEACETLVSYLQTLENNSDITGNEAKELLRVYTMRTWKSLRTFKLFAFTSDVMLEILHMPVYTGDDIWTHATGESWTLGVRLRDSPVVETITISAIVIIGLLCSSAPISKILLTPDVFLIKRAVKMLTEYRDKYSKQ